jgi:hypothetical protein
LLGRKMRATKIQDNGVSGKSFIRYFHKSNLFNWHLVPLPLQQSSITLLYTDYMATLSEQRMSPRNGL